MTNIRPFKAIHYNLDKVLDLSQLTCPPYDVISPEEQNFYYQQSPYNFIRLILNKDEPQDDDKNNRYIRAAKFFDEWLKIGILDQGQEDALYFYKQDFFCNNKELSRLGFIGLIEIEDTGNVFAHENTHEAPKTDRLELIKAVKANLSPIFTIFSDKHKIIKNVFDALLSKRQPDFLLKDINGVRHSIWRLVDKKVIPEICSKMKDRQIFIADGHHRYEVASMYRRLMQERDLSYSPDKSSNYIMTYFTDFESDGLCIMPVHRVVTKDIDKDNLKSSFKMKKLNSFIDLDDKLTSSSKKDCLFGFMSNNDFFLLELKDKKTINNKFIKNICFRNLDVAILDYYVLTELLNLDKSDIIYTNDIGQVRDFLSHNIGSAAFILRSTSVREIKEVALCGERMPPKSTYFYPKLLSGLVVHKFNEDKS